MSTNENLEVKINEITNSIKGLSERSPMTSADMNYLVDKVTSKVEEANEDALTKLTGDISESLLGALNKKHTELQERLDLIEAFIDDAQKNSDTSKFENNLTRILNDIEALHSKMNSQELQTDNIAKTVDVLKNSSSAGQISKLCDEIIEVSKSYDNIAEILNKNFQDFLRRVETTSSREEFQRLRYNLENIEGNQNVMVSAMNAVNEKQEEIKSLVRQSSLTQGSDKFEQFQNALNQINKLILETTSKADMEVISDRLSAISLSISDFKRAFDESKEETGSRTVINGQLNNIIAQLESLKMNSSSNVGEDIIRLYTSVAEFKDSIYSSINTQLNDVITSMDVHLDKISNAMVSATTDAGESVNNLTGEIQKLNSIVVDGINTKTYEIKQEFEKQGRENIITVVNSIKGELASLAGELQSLNNADNINELAKAIENLKAGFDFNSLILQVDQIKSALDFTPIKEQLEALNKDEILGSVSEKTDVILDCVKNTDFIDKIEELKKTFDFESLYGVLNSISEKVDSTQIEEKISSIKELISNINLSDDIENIKENFNKIEELTEKINTIKEIENINLEIKEKLEENIRLNIQKIEEDKEFSSDIKDALKVIHEIVSDIAGDNTKLEILNEIKENQGLNSLRITDLISVSNIKREEYQAAIQGKIEDTNSNIENKIEEVRQNLENSLSVLGDKVSEVDNKLTNKDDQTITEIKDQLQGLFDFVKNVHSNPINEQIEELKEKLSNLTKENIFEVEENIKEFQTNLENSINLMKSSLDESIKKGGLEEVLNPFFEDIKISLTDRIDYVETTIGKSNKYNTEQLHTSLQEAMNSIQTKLEEGLIKIVEEALREKADLITDVITNQSKETSLDVANYLKQEAENLKSVLENGLKITEQNVVQQIGQVIDAKVNSEEKTEFIKNTKDNINNILENTNAIKTGFETNSDFINELGEKIENFENQISENIKNLNNTLIQENIKENINQNGLEIKKLIGRVNESIIGVNSTLNDTLSIKQEIIEQMKEEMEDIKSSIENTIAKNETDDNSIMSFGTIIEQKINDKMSILESLIDDSIDKIDKKADVVLSSEKDAYKELLNEKFEQAIAELKADYETKLTDIHKIIDDKVFEIVSKNNEIIKDELKHRADSISRNVANVVKEKLAPVSDTNEDEGDSQEGYTMKSLESDIAKIRLGIEKNNKITNFKEFAERLLELKNINLENSKISRVMGSDIRKFDNWLKNTTAKIELLSAKIENSEKIKMDDIKSRIIQSEKNQAMPQKLEEAVMSIYKKYRSQETKIDDLINKIEFLSNKQTDTFDIKEFIDLIYENTKKQENMVSRINTMEDKLDYIQAKIEYIINTCVDS